MPLCAEGDLAFVRVAELLQETFRNSDIVARLSGDEFAVLASQASDQDLEKLTGRLHKNLEQANSTEPRYDLPISIGAARFNPEHPAALGELVAAADRAMYEEKRNLANLMIHGE